MAQAPRQPNGRGNLYRVLDHVVAPDVELAGESKDRMLLAGAEGGKPGFVLDYDLNPGDELVDYVFDSYTTYVVHEGCSLSGVTTIREGAVIKSDSGMGLNLSGPVVCPQWDFAYITSVEDDSVGDATSQGGALGLASFDYGLCIDGSASGPCHLQNLQISYACYGVYLGDSAWPAAAHTVNNCSFRDCLSAFWLDQTKVEASGCSFYSSDYNSTEPFVGSYYLFTGDGLSFDLWGWGYFAADWLGHQTGANPQSAVRLSGCSISGRDGLSNPTSAYGPVVVMVEPPAVTVTATDKTAVKGTSDTGTFIFSRTGDTSQDLYVPFTASGSALPGADYTTLPAGVTIPRGASSVPVTVTAGQQTPAGPLRATVRVKPADALSYVVSSPDTATVTITDPSVPPPPPSSLLNIDFAASTPQEVGFAATGLSSSDYWNSCDRQASNLAWSDGSPSGVSITVANAPGGWGLNSGDLMYNTYLYPYDGGNMTATLTGLPAGAYDFYLYGHGDAVEQSSRFQLSTPDLTTPWKETEQSVFAQTSSDWNEDVQYVLFPAVQVGSGQAVTVTVAPGGSSYAVLNGMQILAADSKPTKPVILTQPVDQSVTAGTAAAFSVVATGAAPLAYQWYFNGRLLPGATATTLTLSAAQIRDAGAYWVRVSNAGGSVDSATAALTVAPVGTGSGSDAVTFRLFTSETYTRNTTISGTIEVDLSTGKPVPAIWAILTDKEPASQSSIDWQDCPSGTEIPFTVNLGNTDGCHTIWVGMRAAGEDASTAWNSTQVNLDRTPAVLHITAPVGPTVGSARVQVTGWTDKPLRKVSYDVQNQQNPITSADAYTTASSPGRWDFQAYDVPLALGTDGNTVTVHAWDLAGNEATATLTLQVTPGTPATPLQLTWPANNMKVCGPTFCALGKVADPSSSVTATITDAQGQVTRLSGWTDRDGNFYVENLSLYGGESTLTVDALSSAGQSASATVTLQAADYILYPSLDELKRLNTTCGGWIYKVAGPGTAPDIQTVTVNGHAITLDAASGQAWQDLKLPLDKETSVLPLHVAMADATGVCSEWMGLFLKPDFVRIGTYSEHWANGSSSDYATSSEAYNLDTWADAAACEAGSFMHVAEPDNTTPLDATTTFHFPPDRFMDKEDWCIAGRADERGKILMPSGNPVTYTCDNPQIGRISWTTDIRSSYRKASLSWHVGASEVKWYEHRRTNSLILETGGQPGQLIPLQLDLHISTAADASYSHGDCSHYPLEVSAAGVSLGTLGKTDANGHLFATLPGAAHIDVTPVLEGDALRQATRTDCNSGTQYVLADLNVKPSRPFSVTVDSDNDGCIDPSGPDGKIKAQVPGQILMVNAGDEDHDGLPNWADFEVDDPSKGFGTLGTLQVRVPNLPGCENFRLRFNYSASDPSAITYKDPLVPAPGQLRLWKASATQTTRLPQAAPAGDYIRPDQAYTLAELGYPGPYAGDSIVIQLKTEIIRPSVAAGDISVKVQLDPSGAGGFSLLDTVRMTGIGAELVEATGDTTVAVCDEMQDSHPAPYFSQLAVSHLGEPHPNQDGTQLVASFKVTGMVRSSLCDLIPGTDGTLGSLNDQGELQDIVVSLNGEPLPKPTSLVFNQEKTPENAPLQSFTQPFATYSAFEMVFTDVEVSTGLNFLRLAVSDKVPNSGLTGFAELTWNVAATYDNGDGPRTGTGLTPITLDLLPLQLDFGSGVTSLQSLQAATPVHLQLSVQTAQMPNPGQWQIPPQFSDDLHVVESTLTHSAILFTNAKAWVMVYGRDQLDQFLQGHGTAQDLVAQVSAPAFGLRDAVMRLRADASTPGKLAHQYVSASLSFQTDPETGDILSVALAAKQVGGPTTTQALTRDGDSETFTSPSGQTSITFSAPAQTTLESGGPVTFTLTDSALALTGQTATVVPTADAGSYHTQDAPCSKLPDGVSSPDYDPWDTLSTFFDRTFPRTGANLTPITQSLLPVQLDFGSGIASLADLQPTTAVHFHLNINTQEMQNPGEWLLPPEYSGDLHVVESTLTESAILFTNANAWVVIHGRDQLDQFLQGYGTYQDIVAQVSVLSLGLRDVVLGMRADTAGAGRLSHEYVSAALQFQLDPVTGDIEALTLSASRLSGATTSKTLARIDGTDCFSSPDGQTTLGFAIPLEAALDSGETLTFNLTAPDLSLSWEPLAVSPAGTSGSYQTFDTLTTALPEGATDPGYNSYSGWKYQNLPGTYSSQSSGGDIHIYYTRFVGPDGILAQQAAESPEKLKKMPDGRYYAAVTNKRHPLACNCGCETPEAHVVMVMGKVREMPPSNWWDKFPEDTGFAVGVGIQAWDDAAGLCQLTKALWDWSPENPQFAYRAAKAVLAYRAVSIGKASTQQSEFVASVNIKAEKTSAFIHGMWNVWKAVDQDNWAALEAVSRGEWSEAYQQSETMRWIAANMVELMVVMRSEYASMSPYERGKIKGRITLEVALIVLPFTKPANVAQLSKVELLTQLSKVGWIQENEQLAGILARLIEFAKGKPVPPITPPPAPPRPPIPPPLPETVVVPPEAVKVGSEVGGVGERIWNTAVAKMATGKIRRRAFLEAMVDVCQNLGARQSVQRLKEVADVNLAHLPDLPPSHTEQQLTDWLTELGKQSDQLFTLGDYRYIAEQKGLRLAKTDTFYEVVLPGTGDLRGHHIVEESMIDLLNEFRAAASKSLLDEAKSPLKVLSFADHTGQGPNSLHNDMWYIWQNGKTVRKTRLHPDNLRTFFTTEEALIDELLNFYDSDPAKYAGLAKAARGYCVREGIPFTRRDPFLPTTPR